MKLKILITPFCIAISMIVIIWFIYPALSSPDTTSGVLDKLDILRTQKEKISEIEKRTDNAGHLAAALAANQDSGVVFSYISFTEKEEEIIGGLNSIASANGLLIYNLSLENDVVGKNAQAAVSGSVTPPADASDPSAESKPQPKTVTVNFSLIGGYDNIKNVLASLYKLKRFNQVKNMTIRVVRDQDGNPSGGLKADLVLGFNYLEKGKAILDSDVQNSIFLTDSFDTKIIDELKTVRTGEIAQVEAGQPGKGNPFAP